MNVMSAQVVWHNNQYIDEMDYVHEWYILSAKMFYIWYNQNWEWIEEV